MSRQSGRMHDLRQGRAFRAAGIAAAVGLSIAGGGMASAQAPPADADARIEELERQIESLQRQLQEVRDDMVEQRQRAQQQPAPATEAGPPLVSTAEGVRLSISGQVNRGILFSNDGEDTDVFFVDNDNSSTRVRFEGEADVTEDATVGSIIEVQIESNSTADVNQANQDTGSVSFTDRKLELFAEHDRFGKVWLGQGSTASDGTSEVDLSGTTVVGYSSIADFAGGLLFRDEDGTLSDTSIGDAYSNLDGLGRLDRIRYDTPVLLGFQGAIGAVSDERWDAALRYSSRLAGTTVAAALAYAEGSDFEQVNGSGSILLGADAGVFEGVSVTIASGTRDFDEAGRDDGTFYYGKLGYELQPFAFGSTAFAVDYGQASDLSQDGDDLDTFGIFAVQNVDAIATDLYAGYRWHTLDRSGADFDDINAVLTGARMKF